MDGSDSSPVLFINNAASKILSKFLPLSIKDGTQYLSEDSLNKKSFYPVEVMDQVDGASTKKKNNLVSVC